MKNILISFLLLLFLTSISCSTEETGIDPNNQTPETPIVSETPSTPATPETPGNTAFTEENPLSGFLSATRYNEHVEFCSNTSVFDEIGFKFKALEKGTMNSINVTIPIVNNALVVMIKDFDTNQIIRTETLNITTANTLFVKNITPLELEKNKTYYITMRTNNYYKRFRSDFSQPQYPVTVGSIKILAPMTSAFSPDGVTLGGSGNFYSGDISFTFLRTE